MEPVKIVLVDNQAIFLEGLSNVLQHHFQTDAVLCAHNISQILDKNPNLEPDIVILGKDLLQSDVCESVRKAIELLPEAKIAVILPPDEDEDPVEIIRLGAFACLSRNIETDELLSCMQLILNGRIIVSSPFASRFFVSLARKKEDIRKKEILSQREIEITKLVAQGKTNKEISQSLCVTENTVKVHVKHILNKIKCKNRQQLVAFAIIKKWLVLPAEAN